MERYKNLSGLSRVLAFKNEPDAICVQFSDGSIYLYTTESIGTANMDSMKRLATSGQGLNRFIDQAVKHMYASKLR